MMDRITAMQVFTEVADRASPTDAACGALQHVRPRSPAIWKASSVGSACDSCIGRHGERASPMPARRRCSAAARCSTFRATCKASQVQGILGQAAHHDTEHLLRLLADASAGRIPFPVSAKRRSS